MKKHRHLQRLEPPNNNSKNHLIKDTLDKILNVNNKDNDHQLKMNMNEKYQISNSEADF